MFSPNKSLLQFGFTNQLFQLSSKAVPSSFPAGSLVKGDQEGKRAGIRADADSISGDAPRKKRIRITLPSVEYIKKRYGRGNSPRKLSSSDDVWGNKNHPENKIMLEENHMWDVQLPGLEKLRFAVYLNPETESGNNDHATKSSETRGNAADTNSAVVNAADKNNNNSKRKRRWFSRAKENDEEADYAAWERECAEYSKEIEQLRDAQAVALGRVVSQLNDTEIIVDFSSTPEDSTFLLSNGSSSSLKDKNKNKLKKNAESAKGPQKVVDKHGNILIDTNSSNDFSSSAKIQDKVIFHEVAERVYVAYETNNTSGNEDGEPNEFILIGGVVILINPNDTFGVLLDNNSIDLAVPRERFVSTEEVSSFIYREDFKEILAWLQSANIKRLEDRLATAIVLYRRGWRVERLYLMDMNDIKGLTFLTKSDRVSIMEKAEWQRDHHRQMRSIYKERVKEKDKRYLFSKYAGILSASVAFVGASSLFGWNYKNYLKQTRAYQLGFAVATLMKKQKPTTKTGDRVVQRPEEESWVRQIIKRMDVNHPRIVVLTGRLGCGKSTLVRRVVSEEGIPVVYVDVLNKEDPLRSVIKALGAPNVDACGDPSEFLAEACNTVRERVNAVPLVVLKLREDDSLARVYNEAVTLACDRRVCHVIIEVPLESLTMANTSLPRLDFYTVAPFTRSQAYQYTQHRVDALVMEQFMDVIGTNTNDVDELFAFIRQRTISPLEHINQKLLKSMRQLQSGWAHSEKVKQMVRRLADAPFLEGQRVGLDESSLRDPALKDIVIYNPVQDRWVFANQSLHTAARCCK